MFEIKPETNLLTAIPTRGTVRIEWALMFSQLVPPTNMTSGTKIIPGLDVVEARNVAAKTLMDHNCEFLFFLDDDTFVGPQAQRRLHNQMMQHPEWDLLTGITPLKTPDCEPNIYREDTPGAYWGWTFGEPFEIDACGMSCVMIRRRAFEKVAEPWFGWVTGHQDGNLIELGEDVGFCKKLREAGGILAADGGLLCGHMDKNGRLYQIAADSAPFKRGEKAFQMAEVVAP